MKLKKLLAGFVSAAMIMGTMMLPTFADDAVPTGTTGSVAVSGVKIAEGKTYGTIQEAYNEIKAELETKADLNEEALNKEDFNAFFTDGGKITWTISGEQKVTDSRMFSFGRAANRFGDGRHITEINIVGDENAVLDLSDVNGTFALPYNWWNVADSANTALKCKNITFNGIKYMPSATYQCVLYSTTYEFDGCTFNGNLYSYQNFDVDMTIKNSTFNAPDDKTQYAFMSQGLGGTITLDNNKIYGYTRGINFQRKTADFIVRNNTIESNVSEPDRGAVQITDGKSFVVTGNTIDVNGGNAFWFHDAAENTDVTYTISDNNIKAPYLANDDTTFGVNDKITAVGNIYNDTDTKKCMEKEATEAIESTVTALQSVAKIGDKEYVSLADAVKAAKSGDTITLLDDISINTKGFSAEGTAAEPKDNITLDGNNKKITCNVEATAMNFKNFNNFTIKNLTLEGKARYGIILNMGKNKTLENVKISGDYLFSFMALNMGGTTFKNCDLSNINTGKIKSDTVSEYVAGSVWTNVDTANGTEMLSLISSKIDGITVNGYKEGYNPIIPKILVDENSETKVYTIENTYINEATPKSKLYCLSPESKGNVTVQEVTYNGDNVADISDVIVPVAVVDGKYFDNMDEAKKAAGESGAVNPYEPASTVKVSFSPAGITENDEALYDLYIETGDSALINRLTSAELTFALTTTDDINYEVSGADNVTVTPDNTAAGKYGFNFDGINKADETGTKIKLAQIKFSGYGKFNFEITGDKNAVNATEIADNIVTTYIANPTKENEGKFNTEAKLENIEIKKPVKTLTVNIDFPNAVEDNAKEYQNMKVVISGGDMTADKEIALGSGSVDMADGKYKVSEDLTKDMAYTVKVSGAGYRTARYTVTMTGDKVLNFWNNAKDADTVVEEGNANSARKVTFLAGDIVRDNNINVYDLSAVVSYFGTKVDKDTQAEYAKYDLNRDGVIDSKDVAYVLVSWGK